MQRNTSYAVSTGPPCGLITWMKTTAQISRIMIKVVSSNGWGKGRKGKGKKGEAKDSKPSWWITNMGYEKSRRSKVRGKRAIAKGKLWNSFSG